MVAADFLGWVHHCAPGGNLLKSWILKTGQEILIDSQSLN